MLMRACLHATRCPALCLPMHSPLPARLGPAAQAPWDDISGRLSELGFERGWGRNVALVREQFRQLLDILQVRMQGWRAGLAARF